MRTSPAKAKSPYLSISREGRPPSEYGGGVRFEGRHGHPAESGKGPASRGSVSLHAMRRKATPRRAADQIMALTRS